MLLGRCLGIYAVLPTILLILAVSPLYLPRIGILATFSHAAKNVL